MFKLQILLFWQYIHAQPIPTAVTESETQNVQLAEKLS